MAVTAKRRAAIRKWQAAGAAAKKRRILANVLKRGQKVKYPHPRHGYKMKGTIVGFAKGKGGIRFVEIKQKGANITQNIDRKYHKIKIRGT